MSVFVARTRVMFVLLLGLGLLAGVAIVTRSDAAPPGTIDPNLVSDAPTNPRLETYTSGGQTRLLLRFDGYVHNAGPGTFEIRGSNRSGSVMQTVVQRFYNGSTFADAASNASVIFETADGHNHWHLMHASRYSLWNSAKTAEVTPGLKVGFCLEDSQRIETNGPSSRVYSAVCQQGNPTASSVSMGISGGWRDLYSSTLAFQWVDISDVRPGVYWLRSEIDPDNVITESVEANAPAFASASSTVPGYVATPVAAGTLPAGQSSSITLQATQYGSPGTRQFRIDNAPTCGSLDKAVGVWFTGSSVTYTPGGSCSGAQSFDFSARSSTSQFPLNPVKASASFTVDANGPPPPPPPQPSVQWVGPIEGSTISGSFSDSDNATSNVSVNTAGGTVDRLEFRVDGVFSGDTERSSPWELNWNSATVPNGAHTLNAKVFLTNGQTAEATINVTVQNGAPPPPAQPSIQWLIPTNGATVSGNYADDGSASNVSPNLAGGALQKIEFRVDGVLTNTELSGPYELVWDTTTVPNGTTHALNAKLYLTSGQTAESTINVTVQNAAPPPTPSVQWVGPTQGSTVSGSFSDVDGGPSNVSVNTAGGTVSRLEFRVDGVYNGDSERTSPWELNWNSATVPNGTHTLNAKVYLTNGQTAEATITVTVLNGGLNARRAAPRPRPAVAISGAPSQLYARTSAQLSAAVTNGAPGVVWSVNGVRGGNSTVGTISAGGLYEAPRSPVAVRIGAKHASGASDEERIKIVKAPPPRPAIGPPHSYLARAHGRGLSSRLGLLRQGRNVFARVVARRSGRIWIGVRRYGRTVARCRPTFVAARRAYACRMRLRRGVPTSGLRVVVTLRRRGSLVASRSAAVPAEHDHDH